MSDFALQYPLYDDEAELAILSACLYDADALAASCGSLNSDDFYRPDNREIFAVMLGLYMSDKAVDVITLSDSLAERGTMEAVGGREKIARLTAGYFASANIEAYIAVLSKTALNRRVKAELTRIATSDASVNLDEIQRLVDKENGNQYVQSWVDKSQKKLDQFISGIGKPVPRVMTGIPRFDRITGGLRIPSVAIIGAYPSVGKTTFALNIADKHAASEVNPRGGTVVFFSLEMSVETISERRISARRKIDSGIFSTRAVTPEQEREIRNAAEELKLSQVYVIDEVYSIEAQSAIISSVKPGLVIVDYLQKVRTAKKTDSRRAEIDYISGEYKRLANRNQCAIILLSQLSRAGKDVPTMASLKESGALEADGDYVALLHRPYVLRKNDPNVHPEDAQLLLDKNKFGPTGKVDLIFDEKHQQFREAAPRDALDKKYGAFKREPVRDGETPFN